MANDALAEGDNAVELCRGLFDDATMFAPTSIKATHAFTGFSRHCLSWYADLVGGLMARAGPARQLDRLAAATGTGRLRVCLVVPEGPQAVSAASAAGTDHIQVATVEARLGDWAVPQAISWLAQLPRPTGGIFLQLDPSAIDATVVHRLAEANLGVKVSLGETSLQSFVPEAELARVLVTCAQEPVTVKCTAGVYRAVRHRDPDRFSQHHGYLNLAVATRVATSTGNAQGTADVLAITDPAVMADQVRRLTRRDVIAIRRVLTRVGSFDVTNSVTDLVSLGLIHES